MEVLEHIGVVDGTSVSIPWLTEGRTATVPDLSMYDRRVAPLIDEARGRTRRFRSRSASATWCQRSG
jgi:hypothetical protein